MPAISDTARAFRRRLEARPTEDRLNTMANEAIETGGTFNIDPETVRGNSRLVEIQMHGIVAAGWGIDQAISAWICAAGGPAAPAAEIEQDGFITVHPPQTLPGGLRTTSARH